MVCLFFPFNSSEGIKSQAKQRKKKLYTSQCQSEVHKRDSDLDGRCPRSAFLSIFTLTTNYSPNFPPNKGKKKLIYANVFTFRNTNGKLVLAQWILRRRKSKIFLLNAVMKNFRLLVQGRL